MAAKEYVTAEGLEQMKARLAELKEQLKALRIYKGEEAIHAGDSWHDNPVFNQAEAAERTLVRSILELDERIRHAKLIEVSGDGSRVTRGCYVQIRFSDGSTERYQILGEPESNPLAGILSYKSPLGQALLNHRVGDHVSYQVQDFEEMVEIVEVSVPQP